MAHKFSVTAVHLQKETAVMAPKGSWQSHGKQIGRGFCEDLVKMVRLTRIYPPLYNLLTLGEFFVQSMKVRGISLLCHLFLVWFFVSY